MFCAFPSLQGGAGVVLHASGRSDRSSDNTLFPENLLKQEQSGLTSELQNSL